MLITTESMVPTVTFLAIVGVAVIGAVLMVLTRRRREKLGWHFPGSATEQEYARRKQGRRDDDEPPHYGGGLGSHSSL